MFSFKRYYQTLHEGGYSSLLTQDTVITPDVILTVLPKIEKFIQQFNAYAQQKQLPGVRLGTPLGSAAHYQTDKSDTVYGDIDMQIVVPDAQQLSPSALQTIWIKQFDAFIDDVKPAGIVKGTPGHPLFNIGPDKYVQVDLMIQPEELSLIHI